MFQRNCNSKFEYINLVTWEINVTLSQLSQVKLDQLDHHTDHTTVAVKKSEKIDTVRYWYCVTRVTRRVTT